MKKSDAVVIERAAESDRRPSVSAHVRKSHAFLRKIMSRGQNGCQRALARLASLLPEGPIGTLCGLSACMPLTPEHLLLSGMQGLFPLEWSGKLRWMSPRMRCVLPLERLHVPSRIGTYVRKNMFEVKFDSDFDGVLAACAGREKTWLGPRLRQVYRGAFELGAAHSVEAWQEGRLVGGAFGLAIGAVFTFESTFSRVDHAGKIAFVHLAEHLIKRGFVCIDCQNPAAHFTRFGAVEIHRDEYRALIARGLVRPPHFHAPAPTQESCAAPQFPEEEIAPLADQLG